jgi:glycosyltransferase involved in cell wall biosynthesis
MKILYAIHQFYPETNSGTERFLLNLATSVQRTGNRADIVTYSFQNKSLFRRAGDLLVREYNYKNLFVTAIRQFKVPFDLNTRANDPAVSEFASNMLAAGDYNLVHLAHPMRMTGFACAAAKLGVPYVVTLTDFWSICPKITLSSSFDTLCTGPEGGEVCAHLCPELSSISVRSRLLAVRDVLVQAGAVVFPSQFAASMIQKEFPDLRVNVVPHGVQSEGFESTERIRDPKAKIVFGYCGGLASHKGVHLLVRAFRSLEAPDAELRIYGAALEPDKDYERALHKIAEGDKRIRFCGSYKQEDVSRVFRELDVLVIPSLWYETYSFTLHEALAFNVPVIASNTGVLADKITDSITGLTFPLGNEAGLAQKLRQVIEEPSVLSAIKKNVGNFDRPLPEEEAYCYERIYIEAVRNHASATTPYPSDRGLPYRKT